jgi:hypothetical protein
MAGRVTQVVVEAVISPASAAVRTTQIAVEAVIAPTDAAVRTTQLVVEAVISPTSAAVRTTQIAVEAVIAPTSQNLVVSHLGLEVARFGDPNVLISQSGLEVARTGFPNLIVSQVGVEVAYELPKGTFTLNAKFLPPPTTMVFGTRSVHYGYSGTPILLKQGARGHSLQEFAIPGCDLTIAGSPITITWDVWQSHFQWATDKKEIVRLRRDSLAGVIMWHDDPQQNETDAGNAATGRQWHFAGTYRETARSGRYVLSIYPDKGDASLYASYIFFQLAAPGDGPGVTLDATRLKPTSGSFRLSARLKKSTGPITTTDLDRIDAAIKRGQAGSIDVGAILYIWGLGAFITSALVGRTTTGSIAVGAHLKAVQERSLSADAIVSRAGEGSVSVDAWVKGSHFFVSAYKNEPSAGVFQADAIVLATVSTVSVGWVDEGWIDPPLYMAGIVVGAILARIGSSTFAADAVIRGERVWTPGVLSASLLSSIDLGLSVDAYLSGAIYVDAFVESTGRCIWTTPGDTVIIGQNESLAFLMPLAGRSMIFEIQLDRVATFDSPDLRVVRSSLDPAGWEYWDGSWIPIPRGGVDPVFAGSEARYTIVDPLPGGTWYRRVRAGVI